MRDSMWVEGERNQEGGERKRDLRWGRERYQEVGERDIRMVERERGVWISSCDNPRWRTEYWINFRVHESFREPTLADCMYPSPLLCQTETV